MTIYSGNTKLLCPPLGALSRLSPSPRGAAGPTVRSKQRCASVHHHGPTAEPPDPSVTIMERQLILCRLLLRCPSHTEH